MSISFACDRENFVVEEKRCLTLNMFIPLNSIQIVRSIMHFQLILCENYCYFLLCPSNDQIGKPLITSENNAWDLMFSSIYETRKLSHTNCRLADIDICGPCEWQCSSIPHPNCRHAFGASPNGPRHPHRPHGLQRTCNAYSISMPGPRAPRHRRIP